MALLVYSMRRCLFVTDLLQRIPQISQFKTATVLMVRLTSGRAISTCGLLLSTDDSSPRCPFSPKFESSRFR